MTTHISAKTYASTCCWYVSFGLGLLPVASAAARVMAKAVTLARCGKAEMFSRAARGAVT